MYGTVSILNYALYCILKANYSFGEMFEGFADAIRGREREEDVGTAVVGGGRREVEATSTVFRPRLAV